MLQRTLPAPCARAVRFRADAFCAAFHTASDALAAALDAQRALHRVKGIRTFDIVEYRGYILIRSRGDHWRTGRSRPKLQVSEPPLIVFKIENDKRRVKITDAN